MIVIFTRLTKLLEHHFFMCLAVDEQRPAQHFMQRHVKLPNQTCCGLTSPCGPKRARLHSDSTSLAQRRSTSFAARNVKKRAFAVAIKLRMCIITAVHHETFSLFERDTKSPRKVGNVFKTMNVLGDH